MQDTPIFQPDVVNIYESNCDEILMIKLMNFKLFVQTV